MNRAPPGEWWDWSWNPITGCKRLCDFNSDGKPDCYAYKIYRRFGWSFEPAFHPTKLAEPRRLKKPSRIFVCSTSDLFPSWIPYEWRAEVLASMIACRIPHIFKILTKEPEGISRIRSFPKRIWIGTTITRQSETYRARILSKTCAKTRFLCFEPLLGPISIELHGFDWIIIGKLTGAKAPFEKQWVQDLVDEARSHDIPVFIKKNLPWHKRIREFPKEPRV